MTGSEFLEACRRVVRNRQYEELDQGDGGEPVVLDMQTANAVITVHDHLKPENQKVFLEMPPWRMVDVAWKLLAPRNTRP